MYKSKPFKCQATLLKCRPEMAMFFMTLVKSFYPNVKYPNYLLHSELSKMDNQN